MAKWGGRKRNTLFMVVLERDHISGKGWRCVLCSALTSDVATLSLEHKTPRSQGGTDELANLAIAHRSCNYSRGDKPMEEFRSTVMDRTSWVQGLQ